MKKNKTVRVRFAPSPTGRMHLGSGRTALYNYLFARKTGGSFIIRLEDTDQKRFQPESEKEIYTALKWLGLDWDEGPDIGGPYGPYRQTERKIIYRKYAEQLINSDHAYYCFCSPKRLQEVRQKQQKSKGQVRYDGKCRLLTPEEASRRVVENESHVIRFKMPREGSISMLDEIRGKIVVKNSTLDDTILVKSDGLALYHLAVVVDDHLMEISHVFRGSEWLPTFPLHGHLYRAFGWTEPKWIHLSVFLKPSGKGKMSKREAVQMQKDRKSIFLTDLEELGYIPEAVINWIALMGWSYDDKTEFFTMSDLIEKFSIDKLRPSPAAINYTKFDHFNGLHIRNLKTDDLAKRYTPFFEDVNIEVDKDILQSITPIIQTRTRTLDEAPRIASFFFHEEIDPHPSELIGKKMDITTSVSILIKARKILDQLIDFKPGTVEAELRDLAAMMELSAGPVFGILRMAITGQSVSPPLFETMEIIGKGKIINRLDNVIEKLSSLEE
jgi:glutamyl-tRNA synthetase